MSLRRLVFWITFLAIFTMAARVSVDTDTWWHLRAGQWMVENRSFLTTDQFSYTRAGEPWLYPGWIIEIPMYLIFQYFGPGGLNLWTALMVTLSFYFIWRTMNGGPFLRAFILILAATASGVYWSARPHLTTIVFASIYLYILEKDRLVDPIINPKKKHRYANLIWMPFVMLVWANSHGGFLVGFLIWAVYWINKFGIKLREVNYEKGRVFKFSHLNFPLTWIGIGMLFAVCINPSGPIMLLYPVKTLSIGALQEYIQEWQSPNFHSLQVQPFAWIIFLTLGVVGVSKRRLMFTDFVLFSGFAYMGLMAGRNIALFALIAPIVLSHHLDPIIKIILRRFRINLNIDRPITNFRKVINIFLFVVLLIAAIIKISLVYPAEVNENLLTKSLPVNAVKYIQQNNPLGNLFNSYNWGGYLLWSLPERPVFVDGRTDLYDDEILTQWLKVVRAEDGWQSVLDNWKVELVLIEINLPIAHELTINGWKELYRDEIGVLFQY